MARDYTILGLDLGLNTGWCFTKNTVITQSGVIPLARRDVHPGDRFLRFYNFISNFRGVKEIFYEDVPRFESNKAARVYCGLLSILQMFCLVHGIKMTNIKSKSVKKEFTGNGNADKTAMCRTAHRLGWKRGHPDTDMDHDECDAIATVWVILKRRGAEPSLAGV